MSARIALDVGTVRIGVAGCPSDVPLAVPLETIARGPGDLERIAAIVAERRADTVLIGDPVTLSGQEGPAAVSVRAFAQSVADRIPGVTVRMVDERLTTAQSSRQMRSAGRSTRESRGVLDQAAAVAILQNALDMEATTGRPAGRVVTPRGEIR